MRTATAIILALAALAPGCGGPERRAAPGLGADETEDDVRARFGPPHRAITIEDPAGGPARTVWFYDRPASYVAGRHIAGPKVVTRIEFEGGRLRSVDEIPVGSDPPGAMYPGAPGLPRDSSSRRGE